ncbi:hypothetical protein DES38_103102 [Streptohalobacillus salinus]|uniref:Glycosyl hydrolase family 18 (Putative chitinase) n=1 Tax=Streptohalobacillus salinus TaxID=621096 RepID=A0A2V3WI17_9BACI|nr:hypothetical protein [Streptohalobacillus salinus]PXW92087.1 hypothetical protein DES38_103102 [Streptohalobacillus salinus]
MGHNRYQLIYMLTVLFILSGCMANDADVLVEPAPANQTDPTTSLWLVDWEDHLSTKDLTTINTPIDQLLLFTVYFDANNDLYLTDEGLALIEQVKMKHNESTHYLTFVNDQFLTDGSTIQKSPALLEALLASETTIEQHIEAIVTLISTHDVLNVEIDYEQIPNHLIDPFLTFITQLNQRLTAISADLRVVLEPSFPIEDVSLPEDVTFIVMTYNLHGFHGGPGPKTDYQLLNQLTEAYKPYGRQIGYALSNGGFFFSDQDTIVALTEAEIVSLIETNQLVPTRDPKSDANYVSLSLNGETGILWYADAVTLTNWSTFISNHSTPADISIWRAGGISDYTRTFFDTYNTRTE